LNTHPSTNQVIPQLTLLQPEQLDRLHDASLQILEKTGLNVHSAQVRRMLIDAGAEAEEGLRMKIPRGLVDRALETAPPGISIYDRQGRHAMRLEGKNIYFGTGSDLEFTLDHQTGRRRRSALRDVAQSARLCDKLENIDFVMSYALPNDVAREHIEIEQFKAMLENTRKPIIMTVYSGLETSERIHNLAIAGESETEFERKPNYIVYGQFISPLQHDQGSLDRLLFCADHGVPLIYVPTIMMGASGPVSLAGALALANAECLAGLVMHQLRRPGAPFIYGGCVSPLDMKTTVFSYGSPEWRLADCVLSELSLRYNLPIFGTAGASDSLALDAQAAAEWAYSLLTCALTGTNLIHDVGYLESGLTGSLEGLVLADEIIGMVKRVVAGFTLDADELALDAVQQAGPGGNFLIHDHTVSRFKHAVWYPQLFQRDRYQNISQTPSADLHTRLQTRLRDLLRSVPV
jgi:trimethylamine---corrinoid protein Co-methyltransferase